MEHQMCAYYHCTPDFDEKDFFQFHWHYDRIVERLTKKKDDSLNVNDLIAKYKPKG